MHEDITVNKSTSILMVQVLLVEELLTKRNTHLKTILGLTNFYCNARWWDHHEFSFQMALPRNEVCYNTMHSHFSMEDMSQTGWFSGIPWWHFGHAPSGSSCGTTPKANSLWHGDTPMAPLKIARFILGPHVIMIFGHVWVILTYDQKLATTCWFHSNYVTIYL